MKTVIKTSISRPRTRLGSTFILIALVLDSFVLSQRLRAVSPAPDGGYPGGNTAEGQAALLSLSTGGFNTAVGFLSLRSNTEGQFNTAIGAGALFANVGDPSTVQGIENTATGAGTLLSNTTGRQNTANGAFALLSNTEGSVNIAIGYQALSGNTTGGDNIAMGFQALAKNISGSQNIAIGDFAGGGVATANNVIAIGTTGQNIDNSCFIGNIQGHIIANGTPVLLDGSTGQLGEAPSSERFKTAIKPIDQTSEVILALKPVTFRYKSDKTVTPRFGLIAEDVAKVNPDLVVRDKEGKPYSVRYDQINAMLLNEFLKEHRKVEEQQATIGKLKSTIAQQQKGMEAFTAQLKQQAALIQKVSARVEVSKPTQQMAANHP
jgi:Chaperone of endosialidase